MEWVIMHEPEIISMMAVAICGLSGAVAKLYREQRKDSKAVRESLADCEADREDLRQRIIAIERRANQR